MTISNSFLPNRQLISDISRANPAIVTTTQDHGYLTGLFVRLFMPLDVGMNLLDDQVFEITVTAAASFSIGIDTTNFDTYAAISSDQLAQVIPVGSDSVSVLQPVENNGNIIPEL